MKASFLNDVIWRIDNVAFGNKIAIQLARHDSRFHFALANSARCNGRQKTKQGKEDEG